MNLRPRFSLRTLSVFLTLLCAYIACWRPTQSRGLTDVENHVWWHGSGRPADRRLFGINTSSYLPLVVGIDVNSDSRLRRCYYLWFFGSVGKLPFAWNLADDEVHWPRTVQLGMTQYELNALLGPPDNGKSDSTWSYREFGTYDFDEEARVIRMTE